MEVVLRFSPEHLFEIYIIVVIRQSDGDQHDYIKAHDQNGFMTGHPIHNSTAAPCDGQMLRYAFLSSKDHQIS